MKVIKYILAAGAAAAMCALAGASILYNDTIAGYLSLLIAIARTHHPIISGWSPFLIALFGAMICSRKHILTHYRSIACIVWTIITVILAVLGHRLGQVSMFEPLLIGVNHPELRPFADWMQSNDWLLGSMILAPIGPIFLWIIIMIQVIAGSAIMKFIRDLKILKYLLGLSIAVGITAALCALIEASTPHSYRVNRTPSFRYQDYVTRLALYTGDLRLVDIVKDPFEFGLRALETKDDEFDVKMYNVPNRHTLYFLQMSRLEATRVRLGGKPIFHERPSSHSAVPDRIPLAVKPGTEPEWEVVDNNGKYINDGTWLID